MIQSTAVTEELKKALAAEEGGRRWLRRLAVAGAFGLAIAGAPSAGARHHAAAAGQVHHGDRRRRAT